VQVHPITQQFGEVSLQPDEGEARCVSRLELHQYIEVALRPEVFLTQYGAEEREPSNVVSPAESLQGLPGYFYA
jgi:hypothetical protein